MIGRSLRGILEGLEIVDKFLNTDGRACVGGGVVKGGGAIDFDNIFVKKVNPDDWEIEGAGDGFREAFGFLGEFFGQVFNCSAATDITDTNNLDFFAWFGDFFGERMFFKVVFREGLVDISEIGFIRGGTES